MTAVDLPASAWVGEAQTFLTAKVGASTGDSISIPRDDECRLLFLTGSEGHDWPPVWTWKPFGTTELCDTELMVRKHARCASHGLEYESWEWLTNKDDNDNNSLIHRVEKNPNRAQNRAAWPISQDKPPPPATLDDYQHSDLFSQSLSGSATRGIFSWLRSTGYPLSERPIYQHSWIDLEDTDEEEPEPDDADSNVDAQQSTKKVHVHVGDWLEGVE